MNRIVLIGNGFDLAHGLPTKYEDFITWYWENRVESFYGNCTPTSKDCLCSIKMTPKNYYQCWNVFAYNLPTFNRPSAKEIINQIINDSNFCDFTSSPFFNRIYASIETKGWVDIEKEYYDVLQEANLNPKSNNCSIKELNNQLSYLQKLLSEYLLIVTSNDVKCNDKIRHQIYSQTCKDDISISQLHIFYNYVNYLIQHADNKYQELLCRYGIDGANRHFYTEDIKRLKVQLTEMPEMPGAYLNKDLVFPENIMLLNFNYTSVADMYGLPKVATINHIHGKLNNISSMIFGYGDELDEDYKKLLKQTDNECLSNIKSIRYLESDNYRKLLRFIESAPYQIYVMGHSCGMSDRTLLNTLFEHKNCVSIKPYYYQKDDGSDNYLEIVQNICRNFTDMKLMRDRVVNKTFCEPLAQTSK